MNRIMLVFIALLVSSVLPAQQKIYYDKDWKRTDKKQAAYYRKVKEKNGLFTVTDYYISGKLQFKGVSGTNADSLDLRGKAVWYYEEGGIFQTTTYINGIPDDSSLQYYPNGKVKALAFYKDGKVEGPLVEYYPNGSIAGKADYVNGQLNGTVVKYKSPDDIDYRLEYKDGVLNGTYEFYSNDNKLFNKGTTKNGVKEGTCYDYYYDGELRCVYTIRDGKLDGNYVEFSPEKDTAGYGIFKNGVSVYFKSTNMGQLNGSTFSNEMNVVNGIEEWKIYRDGQLVIESFYKDGLFYGQWKVYNFDGSKLFQTLDFTTNKLCSEDYLQPVEERFRPFLKLGERFGFINLLSAAERCQEMTLTANILTSREHPVYHVEHSGTKANNPEETSADRNIVKNYIDPSSTDAYKQKNNCVEHGNYSGVTICSREINGIYYKVHLSTDWEILQKLKKEAEPKDLEIYFYCRQMENRDYDFNKEERPERTMAFSLSKATKEAFRKKKLDNISVIGVLEHKFWNTDDFSGLSAYSAFEEEIGK
ncbi:MAG TPA: hypothetical protein VK154_10255 [Chitinophagales bacterium]|nr:hypothetical protein [Chitinophagales bacterium]